MGGFFGIVSKNACVDDLFYGTDYHSHLGTRRGGMATVTTEGIVSTIHNIENAQFRSKFEDDLHTLRGNLGIGVISDYEAQPLIIGSHLGTFAIVTVGVVKNLDELAWHALKSFRLHFTEMNKNAINPTELVAILITQENTFEDGIRRAQEQIKGSCSLLLLTEKGIYAARDRYGRTPVVTGEKDGSYAVTLETCALPNMKFTPTKNLGPGEIVFISQDGIEQRVAPGPKLRICSFLWIYYGYPASTYEQINVEYVRYRCGAFLAKDDDQDIDFVAGIPDSGIAHALGYANESKKPYCRAFVKYTPTWPRSYMPQNQNLRDLIAAMKLIPIEELIKDARMLLCEDSIVRGTQLKDFISRLYDYKAKEVHMRVACPPLLYNCKFLNFSRSRSEMDLAARRAIADINGKIHEDISPYSNPDSEEYNRMVSQVTKRIGLNTLKYQKMNDMVDAIGLPKEKLCTYCWDGEDR